MEQRLFDDAKNRIINDPQFEVVTNTPHRIEYYHRPSGNVLRLSHDTWTIRIPRNSITLRDEFVTFSELGEGKRVWGAFCTRGAR